MSEPILEAQPIDYRTVASTRPPSRTFAAAMIVIAGLALIVLGGCFLIGILMTIQHIGFSGAVQPALPVTSGEVVFVIVLSLLALAAFAGAVVLLILGVRSLLRVTRM
jgi:hypothetical protein